MPNIFDSDTVGAFCQHTHVEVGGAAGGPLAGLICGVKDLYDIAGHKTGFGSPAWLATHDAAVATAPPVQSLLAAGARVIGKTHTDEMAYSLNGENAHYGTPVNVNAPRRIPGGSSSGSAAAVAAGLVDFALGSDTAVRCAHRRVFAGSMACARHTAGFRSQARGARGELRYRGLVCARSGAARARGPGTVE